MILDAKVRHLAASPLQIVFIPGAKADLLRYVTSMDNTKIEASERLITASQLIKDLQEAIDQHGDLPIHLGVKGERGECCAMVTMGDTLGESGVFAFVDAYTADLIIRLHPRPEVSDPEA